MAKAKTTARKYPPSIPHEESTIRMFRDDPAFAAEFLRQVLTDGDQEELSHAMRYLSQAFDNMPDEVKHQLTREGLADVDAGRVVDHAKVNAWLSAQLKKKSVHRRAVQKGCSKHQRDQR